MRPIVARLNPVVNEALRHCFNIVSTFCKHRLIALAAYIFVTLFNNLSLKRYFQVSKINVMKFKLLSDVFWNVKSQI